MNASTEEPNITVETTTDDGRNSPYFSQQSTMMGSRSSSNTTRMQSEEQGTLKRRRSSRHHFDVLLDPHTGGKTLLVQSLLKRDAQQVEHLLTDVGVNPNQHLSTGESPLYVTAFMGYKRGMEILLKHKDIEVDLPNSKDGQTPLVAAAAKGHHYCLCLLLERGADPNATSKFVSGTPTPLAEEDGEQQDHSSSSLSSWEWYARRKVYQGGSPLFWAVVTGHEGCVQQLMKFGADVHLTAGGWECPLYMAAAESSVVAPSHRKQQQQENEHLVSLLLDHANPRAALKIALRLKNAKLIEWIFAKFHFPPDHSTTDDGNDKKHQNTPATTSTKKEHELVVSLLERNTEDTERWLQQKFDGTTNCAVDGRAIQLDMGGYTPLFSASATGFVDGVRLLIKYGFDLDEQNEDKETLQEFKFGETPLHGAAGNGHSNVLKLLLEFGADPNKATNLGITVTNFAPERFARSNFFLGESPLFWAVANGHEESARMLLENKLSQADPNLTVGNWWSPLYMAARNGSPSMVRLLLEHGAHPDGTDPIGEGNDMPLYAAAYNGNINCVELLMEKGADPDLPSRSPRTTHGGDTPLIAAVKGGHLGCIEVLLERADPREALQTAFFLCAKDPADLMLSKGKELGVDRFFENDDNVRELLSKRDTDPFIIFLLSREGDDIPWDAKRRILEFAQDDTTKDDEVVLEYLRAALKDLSDQSIKHHTIFLLMLDFYTYCLWIVSFVVVISYSARAANDDQGNNDGSGDHMGSPSIVAMVVATIIFLTREIVEWLRNGSHYVTDVWNWIDLTAIGLVFTIAIRFWRGNFSMKSEDGEVDERLQNIVICTAAFVALSFVGYLRATLLPFSDFVGGVSQILFDLFPFMIVSSVVLLTFSFMYWIKGVGDGESGDESDERFDNFRVAFYTLFSRFVGGMTYPVEDPIDVIFGIAMVLILVNVLIAIVSTSWTNAVASSDALLCQHRFELLQQVESLHIPPNYFVDFIHKPYDDDYDKFVEEKIYSRVRFAMLGRANEKVVDKQSKNYLRLFVWSAVYAVLSIVLTVLPWFLGMISFGFWWPRHIRERLFGMVRHRDSSISAIPEDKSLENRIGRMESQMKQMNENMNENTKRMDQQLQQLHQMLTNMEQMMENEPKMMSSTRSRSESLTSLRPSLSQS